jgi:histidine ammonia-lyase/phenylalanine ammonia-lyase
MELTASALVAEALKLSLPASVWSRSTEGHNQDIVSMGMHAAVDLVQVVELCETVAAVHAMAAAQAMELRGLQYTSPLLAAVHARLRQHTAFVLEDRPFDTEIAAVTHCLRAGGLITSNSGGDRSRIWNGVRA